MSLTSKEITEILLEHSYIDELSLLAAKKESELIGTDIVTYLLTEKLLTNQLLGQAIAEHYQLKYFDLGASSNVPSNEIILKLPEFLAVKYKMILVKEDKNSVTITLEDPSVIPSVERRLTQLFSGRKIIYTYSLLEDIETLLINYRKPLETRLKKIIKSAVHFAPEIINEIIQEALEFKASDIHFEPQEDGVRLRFRIDGILKEATVIPKELYGNILNRIKVLSRLRIDEHFSAQDGAIRIDYDEKTIDLRVSVVPALDGETIVIRILSVYIKNFTLEDLGVSVKDRKILENSYKKPFGMILATGPTGSGKTTTLYSILKILNVPEVNITTIEDPVEYKVTGVNQIQVNNETNLTFAKGLRSIVRQDPNIILVGEIRDTETAEIAVNAALTGHLMLSTFHANDAASSIPRLLDIGIEPFLLASTLNVIISQRLARRVCAHCKYSIDFTMSELAEYIPKPANYFDTKMATLYSGKGCERCNGTGYKGRIALYELIYITGEMQELILRAPSSKEIWDLASKQGARSFFDDGVEKVKLGLISVEELIRVAPVKTNSKDIYEEAKEK